MNTDSIHDSPGRRDRAAGPGAFSAAVDSAAIRALLQDAGLPQHYLDDLRAHVVPLAAALQQQVQAASGPLLAGINGCQGSGKSTLVRFLARLLQIGAGVRCAVVSIDDFYLKREARRKLARDVHPLLVTRGVPGTHDLALAGIALDALLDPSRRAPVHVPVFDKARDDRAPMDAWPSVEPGVDLVLLEGWCVGCSPEAPQALAEPVNALERDEDAGGAWRRYVNDALDGGYRQLFRRLDRLVVLAAPSFDVVYQWREQQERQLENKLAQCEQRTGKPAELLEGESLRRFISHYERLTRHQLKTLPAVADAVIELAPDHRMVSHRGGLYA